MTASQDNAHDTAVEPTVTDKIPFEQRIDDVFNVTTLRNLEHFDDAMQLLVGEYGTVEDAERVIGSGFALLDRSGKARLVGEPFLVLHVTFPESREHKDENGNWLHFSAAHIMTRDGRKFIMIDGGTGIYQQLEEWAIRTGRQGGLYVGGGLRESTYELPDGSGEGTTYYLAV